LGEVRPTFSVFENSTEEVRDTGGSVLKSRLHPWKRNLEAGRLAGSEIEKAVSWLENERSSALVGRLLAIEEKGSGATIS